MADFRSAHEASAGGNGTMGEDQVRIGALYRYPLKSGRGSALERATAGAGGLEGDRQWMLVDARGVFLSQRTHPQMARIVPTLGPDTIGFACPGLAPLVLPREQAGGQLEVRVWDDACLAIEQGAAAHEWMSRAIGEPVRLVRVARESPRRTNARWAGELAGPVAFADGFPFLLCNAASLDALNLLLPAPIPMERFRPNVVITGLPAWAEDRIESLRCGALTLRLVKPCTRCSIPAVDHESGAPSTNPIPALKRFRFDKALRGVTFGENAVLASAGGELARGDALTVHWRR